MEENKKNELYIPVNVPDRQDIVQGFGIKEVGITAVSAMLGLIIILLSYQASGNLSQAIIAGGILVVFVVLAVWRDPFDESVIDKIRIMIRFYQSQKRFEYSYYDAAECYDREKEEAGHDGE